MKAPLRGKSRERRVLCRSFCRDSFYVIMKQKRFERSYSIMIQIAGRTPVVVSSMLEPPTSQISPSKPTVTTL